MKNQSLSISYQYANFIVNVPITRNKMFLLVTWTNYVKDAYLKTCLKEFSKESNYKNKEVSRDHSYGCMRPNSSKHF